MSISDKTIENDLLVALMLRGWQLRNTGPAGRYCEKRDGLYWFRLFEHGDSRYRFLVYDTRTDRMVLDGELKLQAGMERKNADMLESIAKKMSEKGE